MKKEYVAHGYTMYSITIEVRGKRKAATLDGGYSSAFGTAPASYSTSDEEEQKAIEQSLAYRKGEVVLSGKYEAGSANDETPQQTTQQTPQQTTQQTSQQTTQQTSEQTTQQTSEQTTQQTSQQTTQQTSEQTAEQALEQTGGETIEVTCLDDAVEELKKKGYKSTQLRTWDMVNAIAAKEGVKFEKR